MTNQELSLKILELVGGKANVVTAFNCMTRLRIKLKDQSKANVKALKATEGVLGVVEDDLIQVVLGPGKAKKVTDIFVVDAGCANKAPAEKAQTNVGGDWKENKAAIKGAQKQGKIKTMLKTFGEIFVPLIPGVISAGLCSGLCTLIGQLNPNYADNKVLMLVYQLLAMINTAFLTYITAWAGYRAAEVFGGTPVLGGMVGMITTLANINTISQIIGLYNDAQPLDAILRAGRGGVLAVVIGALILSKVEKWIRSWMPDALDIVFSPILTLVIVLIPYIVLIMPATGLISTGLCWIVEQVCMSDVVFVRIIAGFISSMLFLPMVAVGMHHGLVALYTVQLEAMGYVTLYPALCMAGAGQVGAAIAIWLKCKKVGNKRLQNVITGALPAGILGVGEPLIYGVTLPMGKPFITAGIGAGFGGAFVMAMQCAATAWGPSGLLGLFVMTKGPLGATTSLACFLAGLVISYIGGFIVTNFFVKDSEVTAA